MPELLAISCHFDDINILDGYTGATAFKAQLGSFSESDKDGSINHKRIMSVKPGTAIPARRLIQYFGENWLVGEGNTDGLQGIALRTSYWLTKSTGIAATLTPLEVCTGAAGTSMAASQSYINYTVNQTTDSEYDPQWEFTVSKTEQISKGQFLRAGTRLYRVRGLRLSDAGFIIATADELDTGAEVAVKLASTGVFDPVTETRTGAAVNAAGILFDPSKLFRFGSQADARYLAGDMTLILPVAAPVGCLASLRGINWKVLSCSAELDGWNLHIRKA